MRLLVLCLLGMLANCSCNRRTPPADMQSHDESVSARDATPFCIPCSQTETTPDCTPSRCAKTSDGNLCCVR